MIRKIFSLPAKKNDSQRGEGTASSKDSTRTKWFPNMSMPGVVKENDGLVVLSNEDPNEARLNSLLKGAKADGSAESNSMKSSVGDMPGESTTKDDVKVDVTLRAPLGQAPAIMLLFTVNDAHLGSSAAAGETGLSTMSISFEIGPNGRITVVDTAGLSEEPDAENGQKDGALELRKKITRVLETSQDIGILVEWVLRWKRQHGSTTVG